MSINQQQIKNIIGHKCLSSWEQGFIESILSQMERGRTLSGNQERIVTRCIEKTTPEKIVSYEEWENEYTSQHRDTALLCARYYRAEGYFTHICHNILDNKDFIPTREHYTKMCENKYALKVIANSKTPFVYELGGLACVRQTVSNAHVTSVSRPGTTLASKLWNKTVIIIDRLDPVEHPALYKTVCCSILTNPGEQFWIEERKLKKFRP